MAFMNFMRRRMAEPSTWRGLVMLASLAGFTVTEDQQVSIIAVGLAISALIGVFCPDPSEASKVVMKMRQDNEELARDR